MSSTVEDFSFLVMVVGALFIALGATSIIVSEAFGWPYRRRVLILFVGLALFVAAKFIFLHDVECAIRR